MWETGHILILIHLNVYLLDEIRTEGTLLDYLYQYEVLNEQERDEVEAMAVRLKKNEKLLDFMRRTTPAQYDRFLEALKESGHKHVWQTLRDRAHVTTVSELQESVGN